MTVKNANALRAATISRIFTFLSDAGEDVGMVTSNTLNFPAVFEGEEGFIEVTAKVVKKESDECYQERTDYQAKLAEKAAKAAEREKASAEKKAKAEAKKKEKEATAE